MHLRVYQQHAIDAVRHDWHNGHQEVLLVAATGAGKTQMFLRLLMDELDANPHARGLVIAHRKELIDQPLERIRSMDAAWLQRTTGMPRVGAIQAERRDFNRQLTIATVQSLTPKRLAELLAHGSITHLVIDECHHATADTYMALRAALLEVNPDLLHVGVTATPLRADGDGLAKVYTKVSALITIKDLVRQNYLVKPRWLAIATNISLKGVHSRAGDFIASELANAFETEGGRRIITQAYAQYGHGRKAIAFTASVAGAHALAEAFRAANYRAEAIDGTTPKDTRDNLIARFRAGDLDILANCQVLTEGFDAPGTSCILMCRPTKSDSLYIQCMGRGLRPANGMATAEEDCLILDFIPAETRNIVLAGDVLGIPKEESNAVREILDQEAEDGAAQLGFTFDGETFDTSGTPLEIVARQLHYLDASRLAWFSPARIGAKDALMTVGLGVGNDRIERVLAIQGTTLYAIGRRKFLDDRPEPWQIRPIVADDVYAEAEAIAARWSSGALANKGSQWRAVPISEGQAKYLTGLARGVLSRADIAALTKGEAANWITYLQAKKALDAYRATMYEGETDGA